MSEIAKAHTLTLQFKASQRFPSMLKNTRDMRVSEANSLTAHCTLVRSVFDKIKNKKVQNGKSKKIKEISKKEKYKENHK